MTLNRMAPAQCSRFACVLLCAVLCACSTGTSAAVAQAPIEQVEFTDPQQGRRPPETALEIIEGAVVAPFHLVFTLAYYPVGYGLGSVAIQGADNPLWWLAAPLAVPGMMIYYAKEESGYPVWSFGDIPAGLAYPWRASSGCGSPDPPRPRPAPESRTGEVHPLPR